MLFSLFAHMDKKNVDPDLHTERVQEAMKVMTERFEVWLKNHNLGMRSFESMTGVSYGRMLRARNNQIGSIEALIGMLVLDPNLNARWATATEAYQQDHFRSYRPTYPGNIDPMTMKDKLSEAEHTILALQEELVTLRKELAEKDAKLLYYLEELNAVIRTSKTK